MLRIACTKEGLNHYRARLKMPKEATNGSSNFFDFNVKPIKTALPYNVDITDVFL
jgi:hypothetical protein